MKQKTDSEIAETSSLLYGASTLNKKGRVVLRKVIIGLKIRKHLHHEQSLTEIITGIARWKRIGVRKMF